MFDTLAPGLAWNLALTALVLLGCMLALWALSIRLRDVSIVDIFWGPAFAVVAIVTFLNSEGAGVDDRRLLVTVLTSLWALRLGAYLWWRNHGKGEDPRYTEMLAKRAGGARHSYSLRYVFLLQGALAWFISLPVQVAQFQTVPAAVGAVAWLGVALWAVGLAFEAVGDWQLARFKADPANRGKIMDRGLWKYTRHPNYFGDACVWWGLFLVACDHWTGLLTVLSPLLMTHLLVNFSGKKLLEKTMSRRRPEYADYVARTSGFFPWPPKRRS